MVLLAAVDQNFAQSVASGIATWGPWITGAAIVLFLLTFVTNAQWKAVLPKFDPQPPGPPAPNPLVPPAPIDPTVTAYQEARAKKVARRDALKIEVAAIELEIANDDAAIKRITGVAA